MMTPEGKYCAACGKARVAAKPASPKPVVETAAPAHVAPPAANASNADTSWVKRHKGLSIFLAIAVVGGGIRVISSLSNSDTQQSSGSAELQAEAPAARCSNETLGDLYGDEVDAWWRVASVQSAWLDETISGSVLQRRLKKRLATYAATYKALTKACAAPTTDQSPLLEAEAAAYAADVAYARFLLRAAAGNVGSEAEFDRLRNNRKKATETASAAWEAFAVENGITLSPPTPIDESKETD